jgi:hypothetical protein
MTSAAVSSGLFHALDIVQNFSAQIVLDFHLRQYSREVENLLVGQLADAAGRVDVEAGHKAGGAVVANSEEGLEGLLLYSMHVSLDIEVAGAIVRVGLP